MSSGHTPTDDYIVALAANGAQFDFVLSEDASPLTPCVNLRLQFLMPVDALKTTMQVQGSKVQYSHFWSLAKLPAVRMSHVSRHLSVPHIPHISQAPHIAVISVCHTPQTRARVD